MVYLPRHGPRNPYYHHSKHDRALASHLDSHPRWAQWRQDTTLHRHRALTGPTARTSCLSSANKQSSLGRLLASTALLPITQRASHLLIRCRPTGSLSGPTMLHNIIAVLKSDTTMGLRRATNDGRPRKGSAILDWVGMAIMGVAMARRSCDDASTSAKRECLENRPVLDTWSAYWR